MRVKPLVGGVIAAGVLIAVAGPVGAQSLTPEQVQINLDNMFVLVAAILVIFMQAGFALVEGGLTRAKNIGNIMMKNVSDFCTGALAFFAVGYAFAFGEGNDFIGLKGWFLGDGAASAGDISIMTFFIFQVAFAATAATIASGGMAERTKFKSYLIASVFISGFIYPVVVHWTWGGGWISQLSTPLDDFAGSAIVHLTGAVCALMGAMFLGPRIGKYGKDGKPRAIPGHNIAFTVLGTFILFVGWFGFNPGSQLAADDFIATVAVNTGLAAAAGGLGAMLMIWAKTGKPDVAMTANGLLAGLVSITAGCGSVSPPFAILMGFIGGVLVVASVLFFDRIKIDDPVGAISVHGTCGIWGTVAVGLFASESGLLLGHGADQLLTQVIAVIAIFTWTAVTAGALFYVLKVTLGLRVTEEEEIYGLDVLEHGSAGYGPDILSSPTGRPATMGASAALVD